jgi:hypothetical protein
MKAGEQNDNSITEPHDCWRSRWRPLPDAKGLGEAAYLRGLEGGVRPSAVAGGRAVAIIDRGPVGGALTI